MSAAASTALQDVCILDGGMGHLLKERGIHLPGLPYEQQFLAGALERCMIGDVTWLGPGVCCSTASSEPVSGANGL